MFRSSVVADSPTSHEVFEGVAVFRREIPVCSFVASALVSSAFFVRHRGRLALDGEMRLEFVPIYQQVLTGLSIGVCKSDGFRLHEEKLVLNLRESR